MSLLLSLLLMSGCKGLDVVPLLGADSCAPVRDAVVARTLDGDTFETTEGETIRLLGINAPEIAHPDQDVECWGPESADWLAEQLTDQTVKLGFDTECADMYGRTLAYVWTIGEDTGDTSDDVLINVQSVREGQSRVYEDFDDIKLADFLYEAEAEARQDVVGLWGVCES
jgi:endonuclease YncB( thermonuclease family)